MMDVAALLNKLPFQNICKDFINHAIETEFSDYQQFQTIHVHNDSAMECIHRINLTIRELFEQNAPLKNWRQLIEDNNFEYKKCLCLIFHLINSEESKKSLVFECSSLYLLLISFPLSRPMNIFYQNFYVKCIEVLQLCSTSKKIECGRIKDKRHVINLLDNLKIAFKYFDYKDTYSLDNTMRILVGTVVDLNTSMQDLSSHIYDAISVLCDYYNTDEALLSIVKYLSPFLSMSELPNLHPQEQNSNLKLLMQFISKLIEKFGQRMTDILLKLVKRLTILCAESTALADLRRKRAVVVTSFVHSLPSTHFHEYMTWFATFTSSTKKQHRVFAQQIILQLLPPENFIIKPGVNSYMEEANRVNDITQSHKKVLMIIIERCYDTNDEVVTKAIQNLSDAFQISHMNDLLMQMFSSETSAYSSVDISNLPKAEEINKVLLHYLRENKVSLRKAALQLLEHIAISKPRQWLNPDLKNQLVLMVRDSAVSVRQQALIVLTQFVIKYMTEDHGLVHMWLEYVLPEAPNTASGLEAKIYTDFAKLFLDTLVPFESVGIQATSEIPFVILSYIRKHSWRNYLEEAVGFWNSKKLIKPTVLQHMKTYVNTKYNTDALMFLAILSKTIKFADIIFAVEYYHQYMRKSNSYKKRREVLRAMKFCLEILSSKHGMPNEARDELSDNLIHQITTWNVPVNLATDLMNTVTSLQNSSTWREHYVEIACDTVKEGLSALQDDGPFESKKFEIALLLYVEDPNGIRKMPFRQLAIRLCHKLHSNEQAMIVRFRKEPTLYKTMLLSLARISLRDDRVANTAIPLFFRILETNVKISIKVLCLIILKDMCTLYTRLVEHRTDTLLICLKCETKVRCMAMRVITELLADGYLKLRGDKMVCYLSMILDDQKNVKNVVDYFVALKVTTQNKDFMLGVLMDAVYFHNNKSTSVNLCRAFSLHGDEMIITRHNLYKYMIFNMREETKLKVISTLFSSILDPWSKAPEGALTDRFEMSILRDVLTILSFPDLKPQTIAAAGKNAELEPESIEMEVDGAELEVAVDKKSISLLEMMIPILEKFKARLTIKSVDTTEYDILKDLFNSYVNELSFDYKKEIKKLDSQLVKKVFGK